MKQPPMKHGELCPSACTSTLQVVPWAGGSRLLTQEMGLQQLLPFTAGVLIRPEASVAGRGRGCF